MGNAPLSSPPRPTDRRVVMPITTKRNIFGTRLVILPLLCCEPSTTSTPPESSSSSSATVDAISRSSPVTISTPSEVAPDIDGNNNSNSLLLPPQLQAHGQVSAEDYKAKLDQLTQRLARWKGGWASLAIVSLSLLLVLLFVSAYFVPSFWTSSFFDHPGFVCAVGVTVLALFTGLIQFARVESKRLTQDVIDIYRPWRRKGVVVTMKHVANVGNVVNAVTVNDLHPQQRGQSEQQQQQRRPRRRRRRDTSGKNCFCVIMDIVGDDDEQGGGRSDGVSVGTVLTDESDDEC